LTYEYNLKYMDVLKDLDKVLGKTSDELSELRNMESQIRNSSGFNPQEKAELLLEIAGNRNDLLSGIPALRKLYYQDIEPQARQPTIPD